MWWFVLLSSRQRGPWRPLLGGCARLRPCCCCARAAGSNCVGSCVRPSSGSAQQVEWMVLLVAEGFPTPTSPRGPERPVPPWPLGVSGTPRPAARGWPTTAGRGNRGRSTTEEARSALGAPACRRRSWASITPRRPRPGASTRSCRGGRAPARFPPTQTWSRRSSTSSGSAGHHRRTRSCCAWTGRPRSRLCNAPRRLCPCNQGSLYGPTTTSAVAPRSCSRPWRPPPGSGGRGPAGPEPPETEPLITPTAASWLALVEVWWGSLDGQDQHGAIVASDAQFSKSMPAVVSDWNVWCHLVERTRTSTEVLTTAHRPAAAKTSP